MILKRLVVGPFGSNCYLVGSEANREGMIIDPGDDARQILESVDDLKLDIKSIVITHGHIDHIGVVKEVKEATAAEVCVQADDAHYLSGQGGLIRGMLAPEITYPALPSTDRLLKGGDRLDVGDLNFLILHTPGHSAGGICLLGQGVVFTGDTLFNYGIGRYDLPDSSYRQLMDSIHTKLMVLPDETIVYPGHGPESTIGAERRGNPFLHG